MTKVNKWTVGLAAVQSENHTNGRGKNRSSIEVTLRITHNSFAKKSLRIVFISLALLVWVVWGERIPHEMWRAVLGGIGH